MSEWPMWRRDTWNTGKSELKGRIVSPQTKWKYYIGGRAIVVPVKNLRKKRDREAILLYEGKLHFFPRQFIFGAKNGKLYALKGDKDPERRMLWTYNFGYDVGNVAIADIDEDEEAESLVSVGYDFIYMIDDASKKKLR